MMKKKSIIAIACILVIFIVWMVASGFRVEPTAFITDDFSISEDGSEITFVVDVGSSMGYVRGYKDEGGREKPHYLKFYSAWGGFNSSIGAKSEYVLQLSPNDTEIYVYHGKGGYTLALEKNAKTGKWHRAKNEVTGEHPPTIIIFGRNYVANRIVSELPEGYEYVGDLSEDEANNTGLAGCKMYAVKEKDSFHEFYLYQECKAPINENTADSTQLQWAYTQWIVSE